MNMTEVRSRAREAGIRPGKRRKADVIRTIQVKEGNHDCYGADWRYECPQAECCWRTDCLTPSP